MALISGREIGLRDVGHDVSVPFDPYARLMYYLSCVEAVTSLNFGALTDYRHYYLMTKEQKQRILKLTSEFAIRDMEGLMIRVDDHTIQGQNQFVELTDQRVIGLNLGRSLTIGQYHVQIARVMFYTFGWMQNYYYIPIFHLRLGNEFFDFTERVRSNIEAQRYARLHPQPQPFKDPFVDASCCNKLFCCMCECKCCRLMNEPLHLCLIVLIGFICFFLPPVGIIIWAISFCTVDEKLRKTSFWSTFISILFYGFVIYLVLEGKNYSYETSS